MQHGDVLAYLPSLRRYARALTGDVFSADDLVQDTLERACRKWALWHQGTHLRAWLFTIMHRLYLNQVRQHAGRYTLSLDDAEPLMPAYLSGNDTAIDLQRCLRLLPDDQRCVLLLVTLEDLDYQDVATILNIPVGTVMSRLSRARARLRALMDGKPSGEKVAPPPIRRVC
jgi:RNA polymerase sigma-70 factor (ECF subfamily)